MLYHNWTAAITASIDKLLAYGTKVDTGHWQGVPTAKHPELITYEIMDHKLSAVVPVSIADLADQTKPNSPWAEDHFQERVSRIPSNPGEQYKLWPHWPRDDKGRSEPLGHLGPDVTDADWAYLAAFVDADGSVVIQKRVRDTTVTMIPRVVVYQKDREILDTLQKIFHGTGVVTNRVTEPPQSDGPRDSYRWLVAGRNELIWMLPNLIRHLRIKKDKAIEAWTSLLQRQPNGRAREFDRVPMFSHTYQERFWPDKNLFGKRYRFGDLDDVVNLLVKFRGTRQAYLPIFWSEDTGAVHGGRVPCTLGYGFLRRRIGEDKDALHCFYTIRSCDAVRHFRDDVYMAARLQQWVIAECCRLDEANWGTVVPGILSFHAFSFHLFEGDKIEVQKGKLKI